MRRGGPAGRSTVLCREDGFETVGGSFAVADLNERADDRPHHMFQEAIRIRLDKEEVPLPCHRQLTQVTDRVFVVG